MDAFTLIIVGGLAALVIAVLLLGMFYPGSGADVLDWKPTRSVETEAELELDDIDQMLEAQNERRRRRGEPERTEEDVRAQVAAELRDRQRTEDDVGAQVAAELRDRQRTEDDVGAQVAADLRDRQPPD